jgi:hypothetical protein
MSAGSKDDPWQLTTPPGTSAYSMFGLAQVTHDPRNNKMGAMP